MLGKVNSMLVCSCKAVFESTVRHAVASGAETVDEVGARCDAGTDCGTCHSTIEDVLAEMQRLLDRADAA